jgi:hypothetical protein
MNRRIPILFLLLAVACGGGSSEPPASTASVPATTMAPAPSPSPVTLEAEVVTMDAAAPSLTLRQGDVPAMKTPRAKDLKAGDRTIRVEPSAAASLSGLKPGMRVRVNCSVAAAMVVESSPAMGAASPAMGAASPGMASASPAMAGASPAMGGSGAMSSVADTPFERCDSIVSVMPLEGMPASGAHPSMAP